MRLNELIAKGGIHYELEGKTIKEVLSFLIDKIPRQKSLDAEMLLKAVLEREDLMSTGIGNGMAIPHPRNPLIDNPDEQFVAIGFLKQPVDWNTLNREPVVTLFLIVSSSAKLHLETLSKITYFCREESFKGMIQNKAPVEKIIDYIKKTEDSWK